MTATEKYLAMNNTFCKLRDAIYESDVEEADDSVYDFDVEVALTVICQYLDYYKRINNVKTREKK